MANDKVVLFKCRSCGHVWEPKWTHYAVTHQYRVHDSAECPRCHPPEPTCGPITVEMVAEMLWEAHNRSQRGLGMATYSWREFESEVGKDSIRAEARAVIRLLKFLEDYSVADHDWPVTDGGLIDYRAKLLDLARDERNA